MTAVLTETRRKDRTMATGTNGSDYADRVGQRSFRFVRRLPSTTSLGAKDNAYPS